VKYRPDNYLIKVTPYEDDAYRVKHPLDGDLFFDTPGEAIQCLYRRFLRQMDAALSHLGTCTARLNRVHRMIRLNNARLDGSPSTEQSDE
jgi:hypothetical protein